MAATLVSLALSILFISSSVNALSLNYYDKTCPHLESAVTDAVKNGIVNDKTVPAALLRMHFHDCFIRVIILYIYSPNPHTHTHPHTQTSTHLYLYPYIDLYNFIYNNILKKLTFLLTFFNATMHISF